MSEQHREHPREQSGPGPDEGSEAAVESVQQRASAAEEGFDDLLDEIDGVLEQNAEEFVRNFVQKGGQ